MTLSPGFRLLVDDALGCYSLGGVNVPARARSIRHILRSDMDEGIARTLGYRSLAHLESGLGPPSGDPFEVYSLIRVELMTEEVA